MIASAHLTRLELLRRAFYRMRSSYELLFFFSFVSFNFLFIFSKVIFNFFCVGYIDGIPGGTLTLYCASIRPSFHYSVIRLLCYCMSLSLSPFFLYFLQHITLGHSILVKTITWVFPLLHICPFSYPLLELFFKLRLNDSVLECLCLRCS